MSLEDFWPIFLTASLSAVFANLFGFLKDKKNLGTQYVDRVLTELYIPLYKILTNEIVPGDGYEGLTEAQLREMKKVIDDNPQLCDPKLETLIWSLNEEAWQTGRADEERRYDTDEKLKDYLLISFNKTRKTLGLPYSKRYAFHFFFRKYKSISKKYIDYRVNRRLKKK